MIHRFQRFELDEERVELRRGAELLPMPRKSFELLRHLLRNAGRVVAKEELFAELWPGEHVSEQVLPVHIRTIRKILGEERCGAIIRTVRGRGYSIVCPVESAQERRSPSSLKPPIACTPFVGRAALMEELQAEFASAASGQGRAAILYGEAGIGKTRALHEFARWARQQGAIVLQARGEGDPGAPPFWTLLELLRSSRRAMQDEGLRALVEQQGFDVDQARERVRALFADDVSRGLDSDAARFRLARATIALASELARIAPLVLIVDEVQSVEESTLRVWTAAVRQLRDQRVLMLSAQRDGELGPEHPLSRALGSLSTEAMLREIPLRGIDAEAVEELVRAEVGRRPPRWFVRALCDCTAGNPFFLRELLRLIAADGKLRPEAENWDLSQVRLPRALKEVIDRHLCTVSQRCIELLTWASVIGRSFSFPLLAQASGLDSGSVIELLLEAAEARIVASESPDRAGSRLPVGEYGFVHALFREAIYARISGPERVLRHRAVGEALERLLGRPSSQQLGELAHHFFEAAPGGDIDRATDYSVRAAREALLAFGYDDAVRHSEHAVHAESLRTPPDPLRLCCATLALGDALRRAGRYEEARSAFLDGAQAARDLGRSDLLAYSALALAKWPRFAGPRFALRADRRPSEDQRREVLELVDEALQSLDAGEEVSWGAQRTLRARLLSVQSRAEAARRNRPAAAVLAEQALAQARLAGDRRSRFDALLAKRSSLRMPQDAQRALETAGELVQIAEEVGRLPLRFTALDARIPALIGLGELEAADRDLAAAAEIATRVRAPEYDYAVARFQLVRALGDGQIQQGRRCLSRFRTCGLEAGDPEVDPKRGLFMLWILWAEGRSAIARVRMESAAERGHVRTVAELAYQADYWRGIGERRLCAEYFNQAAAEGFENIELDHDWLWTLCLCAHACAELGDEKRAQRLYELLYPHSAFNVTGSLGSYRGTAHTELGRLALVMRDERLSGDHFEQAIEFNRRIGAHSALLFAQAHYGRGLLSGRPQDRARGLSLLQWVTDEAEKLGLTRLRRAGDLRTEI